MSHETYDSTVDTKEHIKKVQDNLALVGRRMFARAVSADQSKLLPPEKEVYDELTTGLKGLTYGSDEYLANLEAMKPAIKHHYAKNSHHPEHYSNGVDGMSLLDVVEMLADWKAASERHTNGDILRSLEINRERFGLSDRSTTSCSILSGSLGGSASQPRSIPKGRYDQAASA